METSRPLGILPAEEVGLSVSCRKLLHPKAATAGLCAELRDACQQLRSRGHVQTYSQQQTVHGCFHF